MRTIITRGFIGRLGLCAMGLFVAANLHAAITDADLAKVTQFIQEGKNSRAKAEITILLDDNPSDPNAAKLRKLLDSLSAGVSGNSGSTSGGASTLSGPADSGEIKPNLTDGTSPSFSETLEWIKENIGSFRVFTDRSERGPDGFNESMSINCVGIEAFKATLTLTFLIHEASRQRSPGWFTGERTLTLVEYTVPLQDLYGDVAIGEERMVGQLYSMAIKTTPLDLVSRKTSISRKQWSVERGTETVKGKTSTKFSVNGKASSLLPLSEETLFLSENEMGKSQFDAWKRTEPESVKALESMVVSIESLHQGKIPRMQKALEHLIRLSGGGGKTPERRKEPF